MTAHDAIAQEAGDLSRPVAWRDEGARRLVSSDRFPTARLYDPATRLIAIYLRRCRNADAHQIRALSLASSGFADLHSAYELRGNAHPRLLAAIEAFLLAGGDLQELARRLGVTLACLRWYTAAFFDVLDRLQLRQFVVHQVLADCSDQVERIWKMVGYFAGPSALSELMGAEKAEGLQQLEVLLQQQTQFNLQAKVCALAESTVEPRALSLLWKIISAANKSADASRLTNFEQHIKGMMESIPWNAKKNGNPDSPVAEFESCPAELRADEMFRLLMGETIPAADAFRAKKLPPPSLPEANA